jgi:hypothetical protein
MLHPVTSDKRNVVNAIQNALAAFKDPNNPVVEEKLREAFPDPAERDRARQQIQDGLRKALDGASKSETDPKWFTPQDQMAAIAQSAMNNRAQDSEALAAAAGSGTARAVALAAAPFEQFGVTDPGWIECVIDGFQTLIHGKATFIQHQSLSDFLFAIPDQITIALVGDWGAHNDAARAVANQITAKHPDIVIHLGDIYYAGQRNEAEEALKMWPLADPTTGAIPPRTSFALNGNHEMFSGGRPYFETVLPAFGQPASYFGFRNSKWQILAFDSAYVEHRLLPPDEATDDAGLHSQWNWLVDKMRNSKLPTILLSHHEPVSAFAQEHSDGTKLRSDFQKFIAASGRDVFGWFFGHEHRCTIYDDPKVPYFGRLIGNGCIPHTAPPADQKPESGCVSFAKMNFAKNANRDAMSGFALLKFDGGRIDIKYINEDGSQFTEEFWQAPPAK